VELKGKLGGTGLEGAISSAPGKGGSAGAGDSRMTDAIAALCALGYKASDADQAIRRAALALGASATTEQLIKKALA
jgi:Holliday junction DNA helicase RuvA